MSRQQESVDELSAMDNGGGPGLGLVDVDSSELWTAWRQRQRSRCAMARRPPTRVQRRNRASERRVVSSQQRVPCLPALLPCSSQISIPMPQFLSVRVFVRWGKRLGFGAARDGSEMGILVDWRESNRVLELDRFLLEVPKFYQLVNDSGVCCCDQWVQS